MARDLSLSRSVCSARIDDRLRSQRSAAALAGGGGRRGARDASKALRANARAARGANAKAARKLGITNSSPDVLSRGGRRRAFGAAGGGGGHKKSKSGPGRAVGGGGGQKKSCFDLAENRAAVSLWVGAHRYQRDSSASKLLWV